MKQENKLYLAVGALLIIGVAIYFVRKDEDKDAAAHDATVSAANLPTVGVKPADVTKVEINAKDKEPVTLEKKGEEWVITAPIEAKANQSHVDSMLKNLEKVKAEKVITEGGEIEKAFEKYELSDGKSVHVVAYKGAEKLVDISFGKSGAKQQSAARIAGKPVVYGVTGYSSFNYARDLKNWRFNEILKFEDGNAISVDVENEHGKFSFTKNEDKWSGVFGAREDDGKLAKAQPIDRFKDAEVDSLLKAYKNLRANDFAADGDDTGLADPVANGGVVSIKIKDGAADYRLEVGKTQKNKNRYFKKAGDDTVYVISSWPADFAVAELAKFQEEEKKDEEGEDKDADDKDKDAVE